MELRGKWIPDSSEGTGSLTAQRELGPRQLRGNWVPDSSEGIESPTAQRELRPRQLRGSGARPVATAQTSNTAHYSPGCPTPQATHANCQLSQPLPSSPPTPLPLPKIKPSLAH
ncbi:hypothetical protein ACOMHN_017630 [Nucella lapillus]